MSTEYDNQTKEEFDSFVKLAIEGAKTLMHVAHTITTDIEYRMVMKNNGAQPGLTFKRDNENLSPTVYIKNYFERYKSGEDINSIIRDITEAGYQGIKHTIDMPDITPEEARRCISLDLIGAYKNQEILKDIPHFIIGEGEGALAAYPRWKIDSNMSFKVDEKIAAQLQMTPSEVLTLAAENTNNMDYKIDYIESFLHNLLQDMGTVSTELDQMILDDPPPQMIVLSTPDCVHGASAILSHNAMEQAREMLGCEKVYIIPSSIHEVIIVPDNGEIKPSVLVDIIKSINMTELDPQDVLSDYPLRYSDGKLSIAIETSIPEMEASENIDIKVERNMSMAMA